MKTLEYFQEALEKDPEIVSKMAIHKSKFDGNSLNNKLESVQKAKDLEVFTWFANLRLFKYF